MEASQLYRKFELTQSALATRKKAMELAYYATDAW